MEKVGVLAIIHPGHCNRDPDTEVSGFVQADRIVNGKIMFRFTWQIKLEKVGFTISQPLVEKLDPVAIPTHDRYKFYTRPKYQRRINHAPDV